MIEQLILALPMAIVVIGAFVLMILSNSKKIKLDKLNLIAVSFLAIAFIMEYFTMGNHTIPFLFPNVFGNTFILDDFATIAMIYFYPSQEPKKKLPINISTTLIVVIALLVVWGGIGTSLIPFVPGADGFIDIAKQAISSLN